MPLPSGEVGLFLAIVLGALLEGEVVIVSATLLAEHGRLPLHPATVALAAAIGTLVGDEVAYLVGRLSRDPYELTLRGRRVLDDRRLAQIERFFANHGEKAVILLRYTYGLRTVGYFFAGAMRMPWRRFLIADLVGTATWVGALVALATFVGAPLLRRVGGGLGLLLAAPVLIAVMIWLIILVQKKIEGRPADDDGG